jgi:hypothetical protein
MNSKRRIFTNIFYIALLVFVSLIPLLWYQNGGLIMGHDTGWTLVPFERFIDRFSLWTRTAFGQDQSMEVGTITIYAVPGLLSLIFSSPQTVQKITYIFWFFAVAASMYYCICKIYKGKNRHAVAFAAGVLYCVNHYTLQAWTVAELSKFSAMTLFPILFANVWLFLERKKTFLSAVATIGIFSFLFNGGGGSGIPLYAGMFLTLAVLFFYYVCLKSISIKRLIGLYVAIFGTVILVNAYWLLPLKNVIFTQYSPFAQSGGPESAVAWTNVISQNTSFINLFRLQGFSSWYDEPTHPYAAMYLNNPFFIVISLIFPLLAMSAILFVKEKSEKKLIVFFTALVLCALVFTAGTHKPLGFIYEWLMTHVWGFAIFRTSFYKFGYALWFSYSFLIAYGILAISRIVNNKILKTMIYVVITLMLVMYYYPFSSNDSFNFKKPFTTMVNVPEYVLNMRSYLQTLPSDARILLIPPPAPVDGQTDIYTFGYFSRTPLPFQISQRSFATNIEINTPSQEIITESLYNAILTSNEEKVKEFIKLSGIKYVLERNDVLINDPRYRIIQPQQYMAVIHKYSWIRKEVQFGMWTLYSVQLPNSTFSVYKPSVSIVSGISENSFFSLFALDYSNEMQIPGKYENKVSNVERKHIVVANCETCATSDNYILDDLSENTKKIRILPTSPLYIFSELREHRRFQKGKGNNYFLLNLLLQYSQKRAAELRLLAEGSVMKKNIPDEAKRHNLLVHYESLIKNIPEYFHALQGDQKLQIVRNIVASLEYQRKLIADLNVYPNMGLLNNVEKDYFRVFNLLSDTLTDSSLKSTYEFVQKYHVYSADIPEDNTYSFSVTGLKEGYKLLLDNVPVSSDSAYLAKGVHQIALSIAEFIAPSDGDKITLDNKHGMKEILLAKLKPLGQYKIFFTYKTQEESLSPIPRIVVEVIDDAGNVKSSSVLSVRSIGQSYQTSVGIPSYIEKPYTLRFYADLPSDRAQTIIINNINNIEIIPETITLIEKVDYPSKQAPSVVRDIHRISPTSYKVTVSSENTPYVLLFKETYSSGWIATTSTGEILNRHFPAYFAFNGWLIDKPGTYDITLSFIAQRNYILGVWISAGSILTLAVFLLLPIFGRKMK